MIMFPETINMTVAESTAFEKIRKGVVLGYEN
jgi:hypothetical protein